jgi:hypothetical protein
MRIGIVTLHRTTNYGATLQAYSLWNFLTKMGNLVELIDYYPDRLKQEQFKHLYHNKFFAFNIVKAHKAKKFLLSKTKLSKEGYCRSSEMVNLSKGYDLLVCGSDEIWNINSSLLGFDPNFFLGFASSSEVCRISYAASFGFTTHLGEDADRITNLLQDFLAVSVRDNNSLKLINEQCKLSAVKVLDPTFLSSYGDILKRPNLKKDYVLIYGGLSLAEQKYVKQIADTEGLDTVAVGYLCKTARSNRLDAGPEEWLGLYADAKYVFTNFYHGVIFSLIFRKPFTVFDRSEKSVKVRDLLNDLNIKNRILSVGQNPSSNTKLSFDLDFDEPKLERMIQSSKLYLSQALDKCKCLI